MPDVKNVKDFVFLLNFLTVSALSCFAFSVDKQNHTKLGTRMLTTF